MIDAQIMHAIQGARKFVADELEVRERSYLPDENEYIASARQCLEELDLAATAVVAHQFADRIAASGLTAQEYCNRFNALTADEIAMGLGGAK